MREKERYIKVSLWRILNVKLENLNFILQTVSRDGKLSSKEVIRTEHRFLSQQYVVEVQEEKDWDRETKEKAIATAHLRDNENPNQFDGMRNRKETADLRDIVKSKQLVNL